MANPNNYEKNKHLIGTQINNWTILDIVVYENKHHTYALAQCSCGTVKEVRLSYIVNNKIKDCGCGHQNRLKESIKKKYEYLINTKINGWTFLEIIPPDEKHDSTFAICKCQCGTIKEVKLSYVIHGKSKDCGCGRKRTLQEVFTKSLIGQRFGKLVVIEMLDKRSTNDRIMYRCRCDCGNEVNVVGNSLTTNHTLSCGCLVSYWNMYIQQFLEKSKIEYKPEYTIFIDDNYYRYDFYLPKYNLFIEYDGQQHYEPVRFFGNDKDAEYVFLRTQEHDKIKNRYCEENNINLLRIPYWESKNIETIINNCLQRLSEKGFVEQSIKYATV